AVGTRSESKRYTPCHLSPGCTVIVSPAFGVSVTVLLLMLLLTRQAPLNVPPALVISIQWLAKYVGMSAERSVTSVAPLLPACATPDPSDGSTAGNSLTPHLSMVTSPLADRGP